MNKHALIGSSFTHVVESLAHTDDEEEEDDSVGKETETFTFLGMALEASAGVLFAREALSLREGIVSHSLTHCLGWFLGEE